MIIKKLFFPPWGGKFEDCPPVSLVSCFYNKLSLLHAWCLSDWLSCTWVRQFWVLLQSS